MQSLAAHLRTLTQNQLTVLLAKRRDAALEPAPKTAEQLAVRLLHPPSLVAACEFLTLPQLQVGEAVAALGDGCTTARLASLLGVPVDGPDLAAALRRLTELALIWPRADGFVTAHLSAIWPHPLNLGPGAANLLTTRTVNELRGLAKLYGIPATNRGKDNLIAELVGWLAQPENVRRLAAQAPADVRARLAALAQRPVTPFDSMIIFGAPNAPLPWAAQRGLVIGSGWGGGRMPREVALALREDYRAPFNPRPPAVPVTPVEPQVVDRAAAAASSEILAAVTVIAQTINGGPVPLLKTGGLGVRELRRIAKSAGQDEDRARLTLELLAAAGLTEPSNAGLILSDAYDEFAAAEPAARLVDLVQTWLAMPACPLAPADDTGGSPRVIYWDENEHVIVMGLRALTLRTLAECAPDGQAVGPDVLAERLAWQGPMVADQAGEDLERYTTGIWREAHQLGLLARGAVSRLCRALLAGHADAVLREAEAMLPPSRSSVLLQNDLTAVVTGAPSADLLYLLDSVATPEARSTAWTWRFSPSSVRAALDAGATAADLLARITEVAEGGRVPQTLTYLIDDVARRYGRVQVRPAGCCLCGEDAALLTELLNTRSLRHLNLVRLAPTVLVSAKPPDETLAALRAAGHAPAALNVDGSPAIEIARHRRAAPSLRDADDDEIFPTFPAPRVADPVEIAHAVLANG